MIDTETYSQLYEILSYTDKKLVMKIPINILENIKNKRDIHYVSKIDITDILNKDNITEDTYDILAYFKFKYWMTKEEQTITQKLIYKMEGKEKEKEKIEKNKIEDEKRKKYNPDNIFKNSKVNEQEKIELIEEPNEMKQYKENIWTKIVNKLKLIFCKKNK